MRKLFHTLTFMVFAAFPRLVLAQVNLNEVGQKYNVPDGFGGTNVPALIKRIIYVALSLVGVLFFVMFLWGGTEYLTAGGSEDRVKKARTRLVNAVIGMLIVGFSYAITTAVFDVLVAGAQ